MKTTLMKIGMTALALAMAGQAVAATFTLNLTGTVSDFNNSQIDFDGLHFDEYSLGLSGLNDSNAITVSQGDSIDSSVTLDQPYTIPLSQVRTDILSYYFGSGFSGAATSVSGTFQFFDGGALVNSFSTSSSTSGALSLFAAVFPPSNGPFTFDSFTSDLTITQLDQPATLDQANFTYALVSNPAPAVPEPATWGMMLLGFGLMGVAIRRRRNVAVQFA